MIDQSNQNARLVATIICLPAFWLAGWFDHGNNIADNDREPARVEWNAAEARGDIVGERIAMDKVQLAASYTPEQILRWHNMEAAAIAQGAAQGKE